MKLNVDKAARQAETMLSEMQATTNLIDAAVKQLEEARVKLTSSMMQIRSQNIKLQKEALSRGMPLATPYGQGWVAFREGVEITQVPSYDTEQEKHQWRNGWHSSKTNMELPSQ